MRVVFTTTLYCKDGSKITVQREFGGNVTPDIIRKMYEKSLEEGIEKLKELNKLDKWTGEIWQRYRGVKEKDVEK
jgi:hypothetical protein